MITRFLQVTDERTNLSCGHIVMILPTTVPIKYYRTFKNS